MSAPKQTLRLKPQLRICHNKIISLSASPCLFFWDSFNGNYTSQILIDPFGGAACLVAIHGDRDA